MKALSRVFCHFIVAISFAFTCVETTLEANQSQNFLFILEGKVAQSGMFSVFLMAIGALDYHEKHPGSGILIDLDSGLYHDATVGSNWWNYYFEPIAIYPTDQWENYKFNLREVVALAYDSLFEMSRKRGSELVKKYVKVRPEILSEMDTFINTYFSEKYVIGIHYRGTDKVREVERLPYESMVAAIDEAIEEIPIDKKDNYCLFIATDESGFLKYIESKYTCPVIYIDAHRSNNQKPVHYSKFDNYLIGKEALMDCLLLSRCHLLIRTESNLSYASGFFNPSVPVRLLKTHFHKVHLEKRSKASLEK